VNFTYRNAHNGRRITLDAPMSANVLYSDRDGTHRAVNGVPGLDGFRLDPAQWYSDDRYRHADSPAGAWKVLHDSMDEKFVQVLADSIKDGSARWMPDPEHDRVWGFQILPWATGETEPKTVVVVYLDHLDGAGDYECNEVWFEEMLSD
jgi:hypothetical protein